MLSRTFLAIFVVILGHTRHVSPLEAAEPARLAGSQRRPFAMSAPILNCGWSPQPIETCLCLVTDEVYHRAITQITALFGFKMRVNNYANERSDLTSLSWVSSNHFGWFFYNYILWTKSVTNSEVFFFSFLARSKENTGILIVKNHCFLFRLFTVVVEWLG